MTSRDDVRAELVRSRGFIRAAETQLTKALAAHDALGEEPAPDPEPEPQPEPDPDPFPQPEPGGVLPFFRDAFQGGRFNDAGGFVWSGTNDTEVSDDIAFEGTHSLKFKFGPTASRQGGRARGEQRFTLPRALNEVWVRFRIYYPDGTEGLGPAIPAHGENNKFIRLWGGDYNAQNKVGLSTRREIFFEYTREEWSSGIGKGNSPTAPWEDDLGRWIEVGLHFRHASGPGAHDGRMTMWKDGVRVMDFEGVDQKHTSFPFWDRGYLLGADNADLPDLNIYVDAVEFFDKNPGWHDVPDDPGPVTGDHNEPPGLTPIFHADGTSKDFQGDAGSNLERSPYVFIVDDPEAPSGKAIEWRWPNGAGSGVGMEDGRDGDAALYVSEFDGVPAAAIGPVREIYYRMVVKVGPEWESHSGGDKLMYMGHVGKSSAYFLQMRRPAGSSNDALPKRIGFQNQAPGGGDFFWVRGEEEDGWLSVRDRYVTYEVRKVAQSAPGVADGEFHMWIDGVKVEERTDYQFVRSGDVRFNGFQFYPYWGGGNGPRKGVEPYDWLRYGELYVSGRA